METEAMPDSTTVNFAVSSPAAAVTGGGMMQTSTTTTTIGMDVDTAFPDLFLSNEQVGTALFIHSVEMFCYGCH